LPVDGRAIEFCLHGFEKLRINDRLMFAGVRLAAIGLCLWNDAVERNVSNRTKVTLTVNWVQAAVSGIERSEIRVWLRARRSRCCVGTGLIDIEPRPENILGPWRGRQRWPRKSLPAAATV
jgi:hypothetical protein